MKNMNDLLGNLDVREMKRESLYALSKEKHIQDFLHDHHLDMAIMDDYWVEFLDYNDDYHMCQNCSSLERCPKDNQGMKKNLVYRDGEIVLELSSCDYGRKLEEKRLLLERFKLSNISEELMLTDFKSLDIVKNIDQLTPNCQYAIALIQKYLNQPTHQGLFLHGEIGSGKTTLLAGLMNALAKQGKNIGFIHFPTYLIDLKASFSTGDDEYAMEHLMKVDYLLLDGIGEENITAWSRDEILLTVLSYRLLNHLPTFFTSMYGYKDLENVYTIKKADSGDKIRARTVVQKMKALSTEIMLDGAKMKI